MMDADIIVVGGGVIGTAIAWRAAAGGRSVTLIDPGTDDKASLVAAGMLGPVSESVFGEQDLLALNLHAIERFPAFNAELEAASGQPTGLRTEGTLAVAYDNGDLAALDRLTEFRRSIGLKAERLDARECRRLEPFLAPSTRAGVRTSVGEATEVAPGLVRFRVGTGDSPEADKTVELSAAQVVVAAGWGTGRIEGVPDPVRKAIRSVKGQILRLRHPGNLPHIIGHTIRALVQGRDIYLVPRADGELVVGATQEERDDRDITAGAVHDLLRDAITAVPAVSELLLAETSAGRRPGTSDNGPILGPATTPNPAGDRRLIVAAGHFRNGVLLSAATADAVAALLADEEPHRAWAPFTPGRLI
jgi:glycine oxidase